MGKMATLPAMAQTCTGMVQCSARDLGGGCSLDTGWENSIACRAQGAACTGSAATRKGGVEYLRRLLR